jgi:alpha-galactosidase
MPFTAKMPWYCIAQDKGMTVCFGVATDCPAMAYWQLGGGKLQLTMDTRSGGVGVRLGGRALTAADILFTKTAADE